MMPSEEGPQPGGRSAPGQAVEPAQAAPASSSEAEEQGGSDQDADGDVASSSSAESEGQQEEQRRPGKEAGSDSDEESSRSESGEASSSSSDDEQPLSQRASYASKHELPKPTAPKPKPKRTRNVRFPKIREEDKCGKCINCLNPQRKKPCEVARQKQIDALKAAGEAGDGKAKGAARPKPAPPVRAAPAVPAADDPFTRSLSGILSSTGGVVQERHVPLLLQLVQRARSKPHRTALLTVLQLSAPDVLRAAVAGKLLLELQGWLSEFVAEGKQALVQKTLGALDKLPVSLAALQPPCELGKIVGRLRKHERFGSAVIEPAKRLVARWKAVVDQSLSHKQGATAGAAAASAAPAAPRAAAAAGAKPVTPAAKPVAAKPLATASSLDKQASGNLAGMADDDLFKTADRQRAGVKDAVPAVKKTVTVKTISVEPTRGGGSSSSVPPAAKDTSSAATKPASADVSRVSASPFTSLGGLGAGVTVLGGGGGLSSLGGVTLSTVGVGTSSAKERAAAAARRVPSPQPQPRKEKRKRVQWVGEEKIVGVRWFLKDDPPVAAQRDADPTLQSAGSGAAAAAAAAREASPPGFESAAKKEHLSEAAALRRHRQEEDQEHTELLRRMEHMVATTAWLTPLPNDAIADAELAPARGEDSTEAAAAAARRQQYPAAVHGEPAEPPSVSDHGVVQHPSTIPRIPLSLEEAAMMQQQAQAQQQQQQQAVPMQGVQQQPQPMYRQQLQQQGPGGVPDISATLAQLAASGILGGGQPQQQPPQQQQQQQPPYPQQQQPPYPHPQQQQPHPQQHPTQPGMGPPPHMRPPQPGMGPRMPGPPQLWQQQGPRPAGPPPHMQRGGFNPTPCRFFNTPQGCYKGDHCTFAHGPPTGENGRGGFKRPGDGDPGAAKRARWQ